jgi:hypothetical protein
MLSSRFDVVEMAVFPRLRACVDRLQLVHLAEQIMTARADQATAPHATSPGGERT